MRILGALARQEALQQCITVNFVSLPVHCSVIEVYMKLAWYGLYFPRQSCGTSLRSFVSCTGWRLQSGLHSNLQSCTSVYTGPHLHTLLTSFVRWQMSRLVSDSVPDHLHHWLSAAPDNTVGDWAFPVAAARVWNSLPDLVTSAPSVAVFQSRLKTHLFNISYPCDCTVSVQWL